MTSKQWTDEDVAEMLGWKLVQGTEIVRPAYEVDGKLIWWQKLNFGVSTPPSPEADANAARYVLPWLINTYPENVFLLQMQKNVNTMIVAGDKISASIKPSFAEMLCNVALTIYHSERKDDAK